MKIKFARLENFRNIGFADVPLDSPNVWIFGNNAQGKTNLLEALGLLCALRSFRTSDMSAMVSCGKNEARILAGVAHETFGECQVLISISDRRRVFVEDEEVKFSDFIGRFPALAMGNDDIKLLRGSPDVRRKDADMFISSIDGEYFAELKNYYAALAQRNALLRLGNADDPSFAPFELQMAESAKKIFDAREKALGELGRLATEKYGTIAREGGGGASIKIKPSCDIPSPDDFLKMLRSDRQKDAERRTTSRGPHRDDFKIEIGGRDAKMYASEGQQRSAVIALKLAQFEMFKKARSVMPVILCDDMLGELDRARREAFWSCVEPSAQVVATSTLEPPENSARGEWKAIFAQSGSFTA